MKPSHYTTPRTMSETTFTTGYRSADEPRYSTGDKAVMWACLFAFIFVSMIVAFVPEMK